MHNLIDIHHKRVPRTRSVPLMMQKLLSNQTLHRESVRPVHPRELFSVVRGIPLYPELSKP
jgi:hypothetical protein